MIENKKQVNYDQNVKLPIWLIRHAVTCWWNEKPIKEGAIDLDDLTKKLQQVADSNARSMKPVAWQYRWLNPSGLEVSTDMLEWKPCVVKYAGQSLENRIKDLQSYELDGKPMYEVRVLYAEEN